MPDHYFTSKPTSDHRIYSFQTEVRNYMLTFETDAGVFSRDGLDPGSRLLIESLPPMTGRLLDMGCGWGPVGLFLKKMNPAAEIVMSDINERALDLTVRNAKRNGLTVETVLSDGFAAIEGRFDHVVTNPPIRAGKDVIYGLFDAAREHLTETGDLTIVIRKQQGAPSALKHLSETYAEARVTARGGGYWIISASV